MKVDKLYESFSVLLGILSKLVLKELFKIMGKEEKNDVKLPGFEFNLKKNLNPSLFFIIFQNIYV